jgi:hypothetical protein
LGISTIKKFTSGRGWGMTPRDLRYKAFNMPSYPDHIYIYGLGVGISTIKKFTSGRGCDMIPGEWAIRHFIWLVTLIINIYGLGVGISTIKKFISCRGGV